MNVLEYIEKIAKRKNRQKIPPTNKWIMKVMKQAKRRGYTGFHIAVDDPNHPLGGGSAHYTINRNKKRTSPIPTLRKSMKRWERKNGFNPNHDWRH